MPTFSKRKPGGPSRPFPPTYRGMGYLCFCLLRSCFAMFLVVMFIFSYVYVLLCLCLCLCFDMLMFCCVYILLCYVLLCLCFVSFVFRVYFSDDTMRLGKGIKNSYTPTFSIKNSYTQTISIKNRLFANILEKIDIT